MKPGPTSPHFPWRSGNRFELLINGDAFFPAMLVAIALAERSVCLEMYLMESGRIADDFIRRLVAAAGRGAEVRLLLDDFGALGLSKRDRTRLQAAGVGLAFYNPLRVFKAGRNLFRTHRKLLLVDDTLAFVGGAGITDQFAGEGAWRETMVQIRGPVVADWRQLFEHNWAYWMESTPPPPPPLPAALAQGQRGRVACNKGESHGEIKRDFLHRLRQARRRLWLATAYFVPSRKVRRGLRRAARRGMDVRLLLPGPLTDHPAVRYASHRYYARLLRHGVRIFEYQASFMHTKVTLVDQWVSIGSSNLDRWNLRWNLEANQEIDDPRFADKVGEMLDADLERCREITYEQWRRRSRLQRTKEWFWGKLELRLARLHLHDRREPPP